MLFTHLKEKTRFYFPESNWTRWVVEIAVVVVKVHWVIFLAVERPQSRQQLLHNLKFSL